MDKTESIQLQDSYILEFYESLNCARSLTAAILFRHSEFSQLVNLEFNPLHYNDVRSARDSLAATKFLSKATFLRTNIDLRAAAIDSFLAAEQACKSTNSRIMTSSYSNEYLVLSCISIAKYKIGQILGSIDPDDFVNSCNWGPGATTSLPRRVSTQPKKYDSESHITREAYDFVKNWFDVAYPSWKAKMSIWNYAKVVTVPKNAKTDRTIAIEPGLNLWFQKGIGSIIRRKLRRHGIDLNSQSHNQRLSRIGSKFNALSTIDFSAASDTISKRLVEELLPRDWFLLLDCFRSKAVMLDGKPIVLEKFSSMGNGFTFELESLIFFALAWALTRLRDVEGSISVFGDDVIIPTQVADEYAVLCDNLGFTVNVKKSYSSSYYRESCGSHYWNGVDIKPIFQKESLNGPAAVCKAANNVRRLAHRRNTYGCDRRLLRCFQLLTNALGSSFPRISDGYGDAGIIENIDGPGVVFSRPKHFIEGFIVKCYVPIAATQWQESYGVLLASLRGMGFDPLEETWSLQGLRIRQEHGNNVTLPLRTKMSRKRILIPVWADLGPWL